MKRKVGALMRKSHYFTARGGNEDEKGGMVWATGQDIRCILYTWMRKV